MGKKRKKRASRGGSSKENANIRTSQTTYTNRRDAKIANLYFVHRLTQPPAIFDELLTWCRECGERKNRHEEIINGSLVLQCCSFGPLITTNRASGLRMIETVVRRIRETAEPEEILALRRPIETEKVRRTYEHLLQVELEVIQDRSLEKRQKMSPKGGLVFVMEPRYSEADKAKAKKNASLINEKLGRLEGAALIAVEQPDVKPDPDADQQKGFQFIFPNMKGDLTDMVAMNLDRAKVN